MTPPKRAKGRPETLLPLRLSPRNRMRVAVEANVQDDTVKRYEWGMAMKPSSIERIEGALDRLELARFKRGTAA